MVQKGRPAAFVIEVVMQKYPVLLGVLVAAMGCSRPQQVSTSDLVWQSFSHSKGNYTVLMPGLPSEQVHDTPFGKLEWSEVELRDGTLFAVGFAEFPVKPERLDEEKVHQILDGTIEGNIRVRKAELRNKARIKLGANYGQECVLESVASKKKHLWRFYLVDGNRLYQLLAEWSAQESDQPALAKKFLESFRLCE